MYRTIFIYIYCQRQKGRTPNFNLSDLSLLIYKYNRTQSGSIGALYIHLRNPIT